MYTITIENSENGVNYLYGKSEEWKYHVCENFDENVVLLKNREFSRSKTEAKWWLDAEKIAADLNMFDDDDFIDEYKDIYSEDKIENILKEAKRTNYLDDPEFLMKIAMIINPSLELEMTTIRGYSQSDWRDVVYVKNMVDPRILEIFYFNLLTELHIESDHGDDCWDFITNDELHNMEMGDIKKELRARYNIPEKEQLIIKKFKGYSKVALYDES